MSQAPALMSEAEYAAIKAAIAETARGRTFLAEHARRNRPPDTQTLLAAIARLEAIANAGGAGSATPEQASLGEIAAILARARQEMATQRGALGAAPISVDPDVALRTILDAYENVLVEILSSAEDMHELSWGLREQGFAADTCDDIRTRGAALESAAAELRIAGRRMKVLVKAVEAIDAVLERKATAANEPRVEVAAAFAQESPGPTSIEHSAEQLQGTRAIPVPEFTLDGPVIDYAVDASTPEVPLDPASSVEPCAAISLIATNCAPEPEPVAAGVGERVPHQAPSDPLAGLRALTWEERIAFCS